MAEEDFEAVLNSRLQFTRAFVYRRKFEIDWAITPRPIGGIAGRHGMSKADSGENSRFIRKFKNAPGPIPYAVRLASSSLQSRSGLMKTRCRKGKKKA